MYSQDPTVRRRRVKLRFFAYGVMTIATVTLAAVGIFYVLGYRLDNSLGLQQGGLIKFDSRPQGAEIAIGEQTIEATPYQASFPAREHKVSYSKKGYQGWQKTVSLRSGEVLWLNYARLVPAVITTSSIKQLERMHETSTSPNRELYLLHQAAVSPSFTVMDVSNEEAITETPLTIPASAIALSAQVKDSSFSIDSWHDGSEFVMVRHQAGTAAEFIHVPVAAPAESINIGRSFNLDVRSVQYAADSPGVLFALAADSNLYRLDLQNTQNPVRIAGGVSAFDSLDSGRVAYVSNARAGNEPGRSLKIWQQNGETEDLQTVPPDIPVLVSYASYLTRDYISVVYESSVNIIQDPLAESKKTIFSGTLAFAPAHLGVSPSNRFFVAQKGPAVYVYDVELARSYQFAAPGNERQPLQWADDHHVVFTGGGNVRLVEFDGTNMQFITSVSGQHNIIVGTDGEVLLSIGQSAGSNAPVVQRSYLLSEEDR